MGITVLFVIMVALARPISVLMQAPAEAVELAAPTSTLVGIALNVVFYLYLEHRSRREAEQALAR